MAVIGVLVLTMVRLNGGADAASAFAVPAFETQWGAGEAVAPNFWGPLPLAHEGQAEPYVSGRYNGSGGQRLVQYFDKARMELTDPGTGTVTNGLLAVEMIGDACNSVTRVSSSAARRRFLWRVTQTTLARHTRC